MKITLSIFAGILCGVAVLILIPSGTPENEVKAQVNAQSLTPQGGAILKGANNTSIVIEPDTDIPLKLRADESYLAKFKLGADGDIYFISHSDDFSQSRVIRITSPAQEREDVLSVDADQGHLMEIDVDESGNVYGALTFPDHSGAIHIWARDGKLINRIATKRFLPAQISVDHKNRIWAVGQKYDPSGKSVKDVQVRLYDGMGKLLDVPLGGLQMGDTTFSVFSRDEAALHLTSNDARVVYDFSDSRCVGSHIYPFQSSEKQLALPEDRNQTVAAHLLKGVSQVKDIALWYGNVRDEENPNVYTRSFIALTGKSDAPLTSQMNLDLPPQYGNIAVVDAKGYVYFLATQDSQLVLKKLKINVSGQAGRLFATESK